MRDRLIELLNKVQAAGYAPCYEGYEQFSNEQIADHLLANDVVVQEQGEWMVKEYRISPSIHLGNSIKCSCCGYRDEKGPAWTPSFGLFNFCPKCGAKMKGAGDDKV